MAAAAVQRPGAPPPPNQRYQGIQKESAGYRLMSAMGWQEGEGLGAAKQGIKQHIKVKKKFENWGVGAIEAADHAQNWTNGMLDFHRVLSNLSEVVSVHAKRRSSSDDDSSSGSEEDSDASDGEQQRRGAAQPPAKKRKQAPSSSDTSSKEAVAAAVVAAAPQRVRAATHIGRFKKREAAKVVKNYSEHDLAAILGNDPFAATAAAFPEIRAQRPEASSSGFDSDSEPSGDEQQQQPRVRKAGLAAAAGYTGPSQKKQRPAALPPMIVVRRPMLNSRPAAPVSPQESKQPGWWQLCFHAAAGPGGGVGASKAPAGIPSAAAKPASITVHGFSEQDQTNLYNLAHDKATKGRVGLGRSSMPKLVAGASWEGKKTRIVDSDDESEGDDQQQEAEGEAAAAAEAEGWPQEGPAPGGVELAQEEGLVIILPASKRHLLQKLPGSWQQQAEGAAVPDAKAAPAPGGSKKAKKAKQAAAAVQQAAVAAAAAPAVASLARIKWKKAVSAALKASAKGKLKLSNLHKAVLKEQSVPKAQRAAALEALAAFLQQSGKFSLKEGVVRAAAA